MSRPLRLLLVEDNADDAALLMRQLRTGDWEWACERVETRDAMTAALDDREWDLVIADFSLPNFSGLDALALIKQRGLDIPFILLSGVVGEDTAVAAMKSGVHDFIVKGHPARLLPAVERELREAEVRKARRHAEEQLRISEERLRLALEASGQGTWDWNLVTSEMNWSPAVEAMHGIAPGAFPGTADAFLQLIHPDDRAAHFSQTSGAIAQGHSYYTEYRVVVPGGSVRWIAGNGRVTRDAHGDAIRVVGTCMDVSARKQAVMALDESVERFHQLAENIKEVFWITSCPCETMIYVSPAFEDIWGVSCAQLYALPAIWIESIHPEDRPRVRRAFAEGPTNGSFIEEYRVVRPDGAIRWVLARGFAVRDSSGAIYRIAGTAEDITEKKASEASLEAHRVTIERANRELERNNKRLADLYSTAQRFMDNVSHEFRTPLTVIKGYAELMGEGMAGPVSGQQAEFLDLIVDRSRELAQMVEDLLDTSKLRAGTLRVDRRPARIDDIIARVRPTLLRTAAVKKVRIVERLDEPLPGVFADTEKAGRVILNLVVNAIKFSPEQSEVTLWARRAEEGGVRVGVTDQGPGIAPENLAVIFRRFKQLANTPSGCTEGIGLGLNIAEELVALNLGAIGVVSEPGKGSTFSFTLAPDDPAEVLRRYLDYLAVAASPSTVAEIRVTSELADGINNELRGFIASAINPMDLILGPSDGSSLLIVGASADPQRFTERLRAAMESLRGRYGEPDFMKALQVEQVGTWHYPAQERQAVERVLQELAKEALHV
jgi:PAS domain S-box-containing protein